MPEKKKILIRIGSLRHGGAEKVLATFLKNLPPDKYEIDLLLNLYSGKYLSEIPDWINILYLNKGEMITTNRLQDIPTKVFRVLYQKLLKSFPQLLYCFILKNKKYDLEFAAIHGLRDDILNSPIKNSKKIIWIHSDKEQNPLELQRYFKYDKILIISDKTERTFKKLAQTEDEKNKIVRIYNPLDTEEILSKSKKPSTVNQQPSTNSLIPIFISVGTVYPAKGFDRLLKVHKRLLEEGFPHKVLIVGDGYDFENIKHLKSELGVDDTTKMLGFTDNPYPYLKNANFFVLSSRYEGFPTVLFEAITLKKNIIATEVSGVKEMLENGKLGLIIENSEEGIYKGMKQALQHPESFRMYQTELEKYRMPFNLKNSVQAIMKIMDEV
ncbi:glycosyltransferase [Elizabethkingia sp. JS20170427COW]|uniref:glycosyltransferase n=1 Tax=Elizabethkingia sp. JS20170427COW TaxID=2583851 RepID=UPI001110BB16|nr:glycosyltransferase [Elizabethkingia sp. JS20170427COW]QCX53419.1 glycosyltransferase [Elizabethkingia sp. JS20170427COW]